MIETSKYLLNFSGVRLFNSLNLRGIPTTILIKQNRVIRKKEGKDIKEKMVIDNGLQTLNLIQLIPMVIFLQPRKKF